MPNVVVIGAGVTGLTTALLLARRKETKVTIVAKHMPGDYDIEYTSPWAGADFMPMADKANSRWERETWPEIKRLATEVPEAGIHFQEAHIYRPSPDPSAAVDSNPLTDLLHDPNPWWASLFTDFRPLEPNELPAGVGSGCTWTSVCINVPLYLAWLVGQCRAAGVMLKRANLSHISEAAALSEHGGADIIVNCTGLLASRLGGVMDASVVPARGQTVLVRNALAPMIAFHAGGDELCYAMCRAAGGGTILGGTFQLGNWEAAPDMGVASRIMERVVALHPQLKGQGVEELDVVRHQAGLRPYREGGVRIEKEDIEGRWVVHNYGHAGWGYQGSYGCAERVTELVEEIVGEMGGGYDGKG